MNVITSHRPMAEDKEFARNQMLAKRSWEMWARRIVYFGPADNELRSLKTWFMDAEPFPKIRALMEQAALMKGYTAIMNADIVVTPEMHTVESMLKRSGKVCASSRRYHFDPDTCNWDAAELGDDRGRDIFVARQDVWKRALFEVPDVLRIGNSRWDAWVTDFFRIRFDKKFVDFTASRIVFHPIHGNRKRPYDEEIARAPFHIAP